MSHLRFLIRWMSVVSLVFLALVQLGCGPSENEQHLNKLDSSAVKTLNELVLLYESIQTEKEAQRKLGKLFSLHNKWLKNRKDAADLKLKDDIYQQSWQRYQNEIKNFRFRIRIRRELNHYRTLDSFHKQLSKDLLLLPARYRTNKFSSVARKDGASLAMFTT